MAKKGRRPTAERSAAEDTNAPDMRSEGEQRQPNPPDIVRKSAILTVRDRKTVQRQREQQQMARLPRSDDLTARRSAIIRKPSRFDDMTPEEHKRRGDALARRIAKCLALLVSGS